MTTTTTINAPMDVKPGTSPYPQRYAIVVTAVALYSRGHGVVAWALACNCQGNDEVSTLVYDCGRNATPRYIARTYLRDEHGIHTDGRWPASAIAETLDEAKKALTDGTLVAVPVSVATELLPGLTFATDGRHPSLGSALVP
jgi:hypothetical protein